MDPTLYRAAMEGKIDVLVENKEQLNIQATSLNKNTVLHVAAQFGQTICAVLILKLCPSLLRRKNNQGETPLHIAAREGHSIIVIALICCAKLANDEDPESGGDYKVMLWMLNEDEDTALHEAVRNNHVSVVELLIEEDPEFVYSANKSAETPLYIAAGRGYNHIVSKILEICKAPAYSGPGGRTALHAAAIGGHNGSIEELLKWNQTLAWKVDDYGWTPLHCVARVNNVSGVIQLLKMYKSLAYIAMANNDENKTALHVVVSKGHVSIMKELLSYCPDCWETVNGQGQNILHIAVENEKTK